MRVIRRTDIHRHGRRRSIGGAIGRDVAEARRTVEVRRRREGHGAVLVQNSRAASDRAHALDAQRVAIRIRVIAQKIRRGIGHRRVLRRRQRVCNAKRLSVAIQDADPLASGEG